MILEVVFSFFAFFAGQINYHLVMTHIAMEAMAHL